MKVRKSCDVKINYFAPPEHLQRYFTTLFLADIQVPENGTVEDYLFPEWGSLRFISDPPPRDGQQVPLAEISDGARLQNARFPVLGPRSREIHFRIHTTRLWSINLNPVGWAHYVRRPADEFADTMLDGFEHPAFSPFWPLVDELFAAEPDPKSELSRILAFLENAMPDQHPHEDRILAMFLALIDPQVTSVAQFAARLGISKRTLERNCLKYFGFSPKLMLRRQRFLRSLNDFTLDPSLKWIGAMDAVYHDQAQFVRDFRRFMGMTPSRYAALEKPIMGPIMRERARFAEAHFRVPHTHEDDDDYVI